MLWDVMITAAFVVVSVAALVCFVVRFILSCLKKAQPIRCLILSPLSSLWRKWVKTNAPPAKGGALQSKIST